jgi:hypothetical protein
MFIEADADRGRAAPLRPDIFAAGADRANRESIRREWMN